jgi:hypothetical protein
MMRPVGWKKMSAFGFSIARRTRAVWSARERLKCEWTETPTNVEARQNRVGEVERAIFQDVAFAAFQHVKFSAPEGAAEFFLDAVDLGPLLHDAFFIEAVRHREPLRVIGDDDIFQAALGGFRAPSASIDSAPSVQSVWICKSPTRSL